MLMGIIGIILSLLLLMTLAYRGMPVIIAAPICSAVALLFSGAPVLASYTEIFMPALADFVRNYFPVFLLGAIFGVLMTVTGFAESIARTVSRWIGARGAMLATVITSALMTYGGISLFVVAFVMFPLARELFRLADIPKRLIPATIALGIFTFTMTALPGSPQVQNIIPGQFFGTGTFAAPGVGLAGTVIIFVVGILWLEYRRKQLMRKGEHFNDDAPTAGSGSGGGGGGTARAVPHDGESTSPGGQTSGGVAVATARATAQLTPRNPVVPFVPLLVVFAVNFGCTLLIFPAMDWSYLEDEAFGGITLSDRAGIWAVTLALVAAVLVVAALHVRELPKLGSAFSDGVKGSMLPIFSTASEVGYGAVVASVAAFAVVRDAVFNMGGNALVTSVVSTSITAAITGSSSGGMTIALNAFGDDLRMMAEDQGIALEAMHRLTAMAAGGLDTLPHSGAVVTLLLVCGMTHRKSYKDVAMVTIVGPLIAVGVLVTAVSLVGSF